MTKDYGGEGDHDPAPQSKTQQKRFAAQGATPMTNALRTLAGRMALDEERHTVYSAAERIDMLTRAESQLAEAKRLWREENPGFEGADIVYPWDHIT